jgi:hypothetical protein
MTRRLETLHLENVSPARDSMHELRTAHHKSSSCRHAPREPCQDWYLGSFLWCREPNLSDLPSNAPHRFAVQIRLVGCDCRCHDLKAVVLDSPRGAVLFKGPLINAQAGESVGRAGLQGVWEEAALD